MKEVKVHWFSEILWKGPSSQFNRNKKIKNYIYLYYNLYKSTFTYVSGVGTGKSVLNSDWKLLLSICDHK